MARPDHFGPAKRCEDCEHCKQHYYHCTACPGIYKCTHKAHPFVMEEYEEERNVCDDFKWDKYSRPQ